MNRSPSDAKDPENAIKFSLIDSSKKNQKLSLTDERKQLAGLFFSLINGAKKNTSFSLRLSLEQLRVQSRQSRKVQDLNLNLKKS